MTDQQLSTNTGRPWENIADLKKLKRKAQKTWRAMGAPMQAFNSRFAIRYHFTSLAGRIVFLNLVGFVILVGGILYLSQFRDGLIDAKVKSLLTQGKIIAGVLADRATINTDRVIIDTEILLESQSAGGGFGGDDIFAATSFPINPELAAPILLKMIEPTGMRARVYDLQGELLIDSSRLYSRGQVVRFDLPPPGQQDAWSFKNFRRTIKRYFLQGDMPVYRDIGSKNGKNYEEVAAALKGRATPMPRVNIKSQVVVSVAVPVQRLHGVLGALQLSTRGEEIDNILRAERWSIVRVALVALVVTILLSFFLANDIAGPLRKLAAGARRVRTNIKERAEIPDFTDRTDEIGTLSDALRGMTSALYDRLESIERFAADVAHELKNPLTSLRSATDTLPLARNKQDRERLMNIILHDVRRLDRLITDISNASRLDAELGMAVARPVDIADLLNAVIPAYNDLHGKTTPQVELEIAATPARSSDCYRVSGHDSRLGQVIKNLLDNAVSFSEADDRVTVRARRINGEVEITVEDKGPGIPDGNLEKIFKRFYTDRPDAHGFGNNSGLGLNISRQIVTAHDGRIWAESPGALSHNGVAGPSKANGASKTTGGGYKTKTKSASGGARFVIRLPAMGPCN